MVAVPGDWRKIGPTTVGEYERVLKAVKSPMLAEAAAMHKAAGEHSALALAMAGAEQKWMTHPSPIPAANKNPLSLKLADGSWGTYPSFAACFGEWRRRLTSATYKEGVYAGTKSLLSMITVYAPASDNNVPANYEAEVRGYLAAMPSGLATPSTTTTKAPSKATTTAKPKPLNMAPGLIPLGPVEAQYAWGKVENVGMNRIGPRRKIKGVCWHRGLTGSASLQGAVDWLLAPTTAGLTDGYIDHRTGEAVRMIPLPGRDPAGDMVPWAQGPWNEWAASADAKAFRDAYQAESGMGISVWNGYLESWEITGDYYSPISDATKATMVRINASRAHDMGVRWDQYPVAPNGVSVLFSHREGCGVAYKECAGAVVWDYINSPAHIDAVQQHMRSFQLGGAAPELPTTPLPPDNRFAPLRPPTYLNDFSKPYIDDGGTRLWLVTDQYRAIRATGRFQFASEAAPPVGEDMRVGEDANINFVFEAKDGQGWGLSAYGTRFKLADFDRISDVPAKA